MKATDKQRYRERLDALQERLRGEVEDLDRSIGREGADPGDLSHVGTHSADHDVERLEVQEAMERNQVTLLRAVEDALERMETGAFGRCAGCGKPIAVERLEALPYAAYCIDCVQARE